MKKNMLLWLFGAVLLLLGVYFTAAPRSAQLPSTKTISFIYEYNAGPQVEQTCEEHEFVAYINVTDHPVYLVAVDIRMGIFRGAFADIATYVRRLDGMPIASYIQDLYSDPNGPQQRFVSLPYPLEIAESQAILLEASNCYVAGIHSPMHPIVLLYFVDQP